MKRLNHKLFVFLICGALILVTAIAFEPMRFNGFVDYDDGTYVTENPRVLRGLTSESVLWAFTSRYAGNWHPLTWLTHMLDCQLFGLNPLWHHLNNLILHIAATLLLFYVLQKMTGAVWRSAFVAAAFAVHPLHVESVAWVAERKDVLSGLFWMLTVLAYMRYAEQPRIGRYLLVILCFVLGLMAKPMLVTLPFVLLLLDYWPLKRYIGASQGRQKTVMQSELPDHSRCECPGSLLIWEKVPLFVLVGISCIITFYVQQEAGAVAPLPIPLRIVNALVSYIRYIEKIIWPSRLAVLYPHPTYRLLLWPTVAALVLLPAVTIRIIRLAKTHKYLPVGWFWYLGTLVPVIGIVQVGNQAMADRYMYLPSIGIFIIIAWGAPDLMAQRPYRKITMGISAGLLLAAMLMCTRVQVRHWQNDAALFGHAAKVTKDNYIMRNKYGLAMLKAGRPDEAIAQFGEVLRTRPRHLEARKNMGDALLLKGRLDEAIACFSEVLRADKNWTDVYLNLGTTYTKQGKYDLAIQNFEEALRQKPDYVAAHLNLAITLMLKGDFQTAIEHCNDALQTNPNDSRAQQILNEVLARQTKSQE